ncbi:hypothetical protein H9Q13_02150 [Pontibacter sp. JH31]|uniref:Uncharacterized protein n=1 Tax=Pontibacter aquaedesilientis TaxID=2766980 RepID=A0ABR7XEB9_9BACT|nr:hypothetical protein [Pontibacter aquaedesilientis]MBD1395953.1 hypothetical protein [Pontibacter aquaedesilientis]
MTKQAHYTPMARQLFGQYLDSAIDLDMLIGRLQEMELQLMADEEVDEEEEGVNNKRLWFRFFAGDDMKISITEIAEELRNPSHPNAMILLRGIAFGLAEDELEVHYS